MQNACNKSPQFKICPGEILLASRKFTMGDFCTSSTPWKNVTINTESAPQLWKRVIRNSLDLYEVMLIWITQFCFFSKVLSSVKKFKACFSNWCLYSPWCEVDVELPSVENVSTNSTVPNERVTCRAQDVTMCHTRGKLHTITLMLHCSKMNKIKQK